MNITRLAAVVGGCAILAASTHAQTFRIDMGPSTNETLSPDVNGNVWNNFSPGDWFRVVDTTGALNGSSSVDGIGFGGTTPVGAGLPGEGLVFPDPLLLGDMAISTATEDFLFRFDDGIAPAETLGFEFSYLDTNLTYNVRFFCSALAVEDRETLIEVTGASGTQSATVFTSGVSAGPNLENEDVIVEILGVTPNINETLQLDFTALQGDFTHINIIELEVAGGVSINFTTQPVGTVVDAGSSMIYTAAVDSSDPSYTLQWELDGVPLVDGGDVSGATTDTLTIANASLADVGVYRLVATAQGQSFNSWEVIGAVRGSPFGIADFNNDGTLDFFDVLDFLQVFDAG